VTARLALLVAGLLLAAPLPAEAKVSPAARKRARKLIKNGDMSYRLLKFDQALAHYEEAYKLTGHPAIIFNIAQAYRQLKNHTKALFYYKLLLVDWAKRYPKKPPPYREEVEGHIESITKLIEVEEEKQRAAQREKARAKPKPTVGQLELTGLRQGARIYIDGSRKKTGPSVALKPGKHRLRVELEGFRSWEGTVRLDAGEQRAEPVDLRVTDHRTAWLIASLSLTAVAGGLLGLGAFYNVRHNDFLVDTPEADDNRRLSVIGYATSGGAAALAAVSWTFYLLHRGRVLRLMETKRISLAPLPGGALAAGRLSF
jgi:tetratricopeptide (TPR) repeat protein